MRCKYLALTLLLVVGLGTGCQKKPMYYWADYSQTNYTLVKEQTIQAASEHTTELEKIINEADSHKLAVPPGIYCEYGFMLMQNGNYKEAIAQYSLEKAKFPESACLMDRLIADAQSALEKEEKAKELEENQDASLIS